MTIGSRSGRASRLLDPRRLVGRLALLLAVPGGLLAQFNGPDGCMPRRGGVAVAEVGGINLFVNRLDVLLGEETQKVSLESWSRNIRLGWEWDENSFGTNMLSHPYHGSTYFNAGRANCLTYWESIPLAFLGSFTWEYFGETNRPSLNDYFMTSLGGIALGEMLHRVGILVRDETATGAERIIREIAGMLVNPVTGVNRLVNGQWRGVRENPAEKHPGLLRMDMKLGARQVFASDSTSECDVCATVIADFHYGDPLNTAYTRPFDVFSVHLQVSPGGGGFNTLEAVGRLYQKDLNGRDAGIRHGILVSQRYAYNTYTPVLSYGAQSVEAGLVSRFPIGERWQLNTRFSGDLVMMGAISDEQYNVVDRTYDFGPGAGVGFNIQLWKQHQRYLNISSRLEWLHTVSGEGTDHYVTISRAELLLPISARVGFGVSADYASRTSQLADFPSQSRRFGDMRAFVSWGVQP